MVYKLIWSPSARFDLKELAVFIAEDNPSAAHRFGKIVEMTEARS